MDLQATLNLIEPELQRTSSRWALIGGQALAFLGIPRSTLDTDFVVDATAQESLVKFLESRGYETLHRSAGYSNHLHHEPRLGRVDFVYVAGETADAIFGSCQQVTGPTGFSLPIPKPEHLIAMKLHAVSNDTTRRHQDLADIQSLLSLPGVDRQEVRSAFEKRGLGKELDALEANL
ncbi:MAG: nucleotidyl transferase AbiEii/AbiGii toxin family protein [Acidobacteriota bacterium]